MNNDIRKKIIELYKNGKGSTTIEREIGVAKHKILKVLNDEKLIKQRDRCKKLDIKNNGDMFYVVRICPKCGNEIKMSSKYKIMACRNYFKSIKNNQLCKPCSLILQVGEGNPFYGKKHSETTKKQISNSRKGKGTGENNCMSNPKWREKSSKNLKKRWDSGELEKTRIRMSEVMKETRRKGKLKSVITSKKEKEIGQLIKKMGYEIIPSFKVDTKICDIFIPKLNLIIEYFGDYWHCNPIKYSEDYINSNKKMTAKEIWDYDNKKIDLIKDYGYNLEVIWESNLKNDNKLINKIIEKYDKSK
jgi:G:T-mismatch repair DNA endonuclease (very short patch repair protein)